MNKGKSSKSAGGGDWMQPESQKRGHRRVSSSSINKNRKSNSASLLTVSDEVNKESPSSDNNRGLVPSTPPEVGDIESFFKSRGLTLSQIQRLNRNYVGGNDGYGSPRSRGGAIFWDSFSPPPGIPVPAKENSAVTPKNENSSQAVVNSRKYVSPSIYTAEIYSKTVKKAKTLVKGRDKEEAEVQDLLNRLKKRPRPKPPTGFPKRNSHEKTDNENLNLVSPNPSVVTLVPITPIPSTPVANTSVSDTSFPDLEGDLNDSALIRCSQAVEEEFFKEKSAEGKENSRRFNAKGKGIEEEESPIMGVMGMNPNNNRPLQSSTPLTHEGLGVGLATTTNSNERRRRRSSRLRYNNGDSSSKTSTNTSTYSSSSLGFFENSSVEMPSTSSHSSSLSRQQLPRKSLFNSTTAQMNNPTSKTPEVVGDFDDDEDDDLFSQIEMS